MASAPSVTMCRGESSDEEMEFVERGSNNQRGERVSSARTTRCVI